MKPLSLFCALFAISLSVYGQKIPSADAQIKAALNAAPSELRDGAGVYGYNQAGELITLRAAGNGLVCLADDPGSEGLSVACYQKDLDPFMARGRELKKEGKSGKEIFEIREEEVKSGKLTIPKGSILYVFTADAPQVNWETGEVADGYLRYVVYLPFETPETTGLPSKPDFAGQPWLMDPGTHRAHIMISPPRN